MKHGILCVLLAVFVSGCGKSVPPAGETVRGHFENLQAAQMEVKILCDFGQSALEYRVDYEYNKEDNDLLTVTEPEAIAGVAVEIAGQQDFTLQYQDAALEFGRDAVSGLTPVDAIADLMYDLCTGEPTEIGKDTIDGVQAVSLHYETIDVQPEISKTVWLEPDTMAPLCTELYCDGQKRVTLFFEQFEQS
ncbi:MAG: hypothetical protein Q4A63_03160 [Butyricicoccus pullicaecorum]|nr:hypothetical protein [Butyricicoccus pullicaecorum]MDO4668796.1 hypothetical protein [Butyricicoccus pullicaecorum]